VWSHRQRLTIPPVDRVDNTGFSTNSSNNNNNCTTRLRQGRGYWVSAYWREAYSTLGLTFHQIINDSYRDCCMRTNIRSLRYKTGELEAEILNNNIDICCITESWLTDAIPTGAVNTNGYCVLPSRPNRWTACGCRHDLPYALLKPVDNSGVESLWLLYRQPHVPRSMSTIIYGVVYHPPDATTRLTTTHITDNIDDTVRRHSNAASVRVGDFNKMTDKPLQDIKLKQIVQRATRKSAILDTIHTVIGEW